MILIKNANLISMAEINYEVVDILVEDGKIKNIGKIDEKEYRDITVIDALGKFVTPGLVDPHCHIGMIEEAIGFEGSDVNEMTDPICPELRAFDAVKPQEILIKYNNIVEPMFRKIQNLYDENQRLQDLRNYLIDFFMTGQVKIKR